MALSINLLIDFVHAITGLNSAKYEHTCNK